MKEFELCGIGNCIVDLLLHTSEEEFQKMAFERGSSRLVTEEEQRTTLESIGHHDLHVVSGGSCANSVALFAELGGKASMIGSLGDDVYGRGYAKEMGELSISFAVNTIKEGHTGTCLSLITPEGERTMRTHLGVAGEPELTALGKSYLTQSKVLLLEGYLLPGEKGQKVFKEALAVAQEHQVEVALTCSDTWVVDGFRELFEEGVQPSTYLFANEAEAKTLTRTDSIEEAVKKLTPSKGITVVTLGEKGVLVIEGDRHTHVPGFPVAPLDLTGAGDAFAGAFLYGLSSGLSPVESAKRANFLASKVITQYGARLPHGVKQLWGSI